MSPALWKTISDQKSRAGATIVLFPGKKGIYNTLMIHIFQSHFSPGLQSIFLGARTTCIVPIRHVFFPQTRSENTFRTHESHPSLSCCHSPSQVNFIFHVPREYASTHFLTSAACLLLAMFSSPDSLADTWAGLNCPLFATTSLPTLHWFVFEYFGFRK